MKIIGVSGRHLGLRRLLRLARDEGQGLAPQFVEQQPRADLGVVRLGFDERAGGEDRRQRQLVPADAVIEVALGLGEYRIGRNAFKFGASLLDDAGEACGVDRGEGSVRSLHPES